jgi:hypothetical protein
MIVGNPTLRGMLREQDLAMDDTGSGSCPVAGSIISSVEPPVVLSERQLISLCIYHFNVTVICR